MLLRRPRGGALTGSLFASLLIQALNAFTGILLARELGANGRGELTALLLWVGLVAVMGSIGVSESTVYHAARRADERGKVVGTTLAIWLCQSAVLVVVGLAVVEIAVQRNADIGPVAYLFLAYIPLWLFGAYATSVLQGIQAFRSFQATRILVAGATATGLAGAALADKLTVATAAAAYLLSYAGLALVAAALVARSGVGRPSVNHTVLRSMLGFGARSHTSTVAASLNERLDQFVISVVLAPAFLGLYVVAVTFASAAALAASSIALVALPRIAALAPGRERIDLALRYIRIAIIGSALLVAPLLVFTDDALRLLFGSDFTAAATPARILLVASVALAATRVLAATLRALGEPMRAGGADAVGVAVTAIGLAVLLPLFGLTGAAIASLIAYCVSAGLMGHAVARTLDISPVGLISSRSVAALPQPTPGTGT